MARIFERFTLATAAAIILSMLCQGCNTSGCTDNQNSLPLAGFYASGAKDDNRISISTLDISGVGRNPDSLLYTSGTAISMAYLPFRSDAGATAYAFHYTQEGLDSPLLNDTISFTYTSQPYFASEECGAMLTYTIESMSFTTHLIDSVVIIDPVITNTDVERIKIYFRTE